MSSGGAHETAPRKPPKRGGTKARGANPGAGLILQTLPNVAAGARDLTVVNNNAGNADQGGRRQVTIISRAAWDAVSDDLGAPVDPSARRANLLVRGVDLAHSHGRVLAIGGIRVRIHGETRPCALMDEMHSGLRRALDPDWRAGAFGEVLDSGTLSVGDPVGWVEAPVSER